MTVVVGGTAAVAAIAAALAVALAAALAAALIPALPAALDAALAADFAAAHAAAYGLHLFVGPRFAFTPSCSWCLLLCAKSLLHLVCSRQISRRPQVQLHLFRKVLPL